MSDGTYAGDIAPKKTFETIHANGIMVDVRTRAEWGYVGTPLLPQLILTEWQTYPDMGVNPHFTEQVIAEITKRGGTKSTPIYFLCRSGVRSKSAARALTEAGFTHCYNISDGFEGPPDEMGHRGNIAGWKADGLPWRQN